MSEPADGADGPLSLLAACLGEPARGKRRLPAVLGLLEADDDATRVAAGWTVCLVAAEHPGTVEYLVRRLADRLDGDEVTLELTHTLDYLVDRHPDRVETALAERAAEAAERRNRPAGDSPRRGFTRNHYHGGRSPNRSGVGRVAVPGGAGGDDPRQAYTDDAEPRPVPADTGGEDDAGATASGGEAPEDDAVADEDASGTLGEPTAVVSAIATRSRFDRVHVLASRSRSRYSADYRALVGRSGEESAIALRVVDRPDDLATRSEFESTWERRIRRWADLPAHPHVTPVLDWGLEPRPWLATAVAAESMADLGEGPPGEAHHDALALADALTHLHRHDAIHGGVDPGNVAYPAAELGGDGPEPPLLDNVGLVPAFRYHVDPATVLDPRYAAPEYYDRRFGAVDAATDVYGLGAVVYRLYAGEHPFAGPFESVRAAVTGPETPVPGDVADDVPSAVDDVVAKAMATDKLRRYETADHLAAEFRSIRETDL